MEQVFSEEQLRLLNTPLTRDEIAYKEGQRYLPSHLAIAKANRIFGPGNWGFAITSPFETMDTGKTTKNGSIIYRVRVQVTLEVRGALSITDIGDCEANGTTAPAMGMAEKGAVSDGVKRCLRIYGSAFGLDLYDDDWKPEQEAPKPLIKNDPVPALVRQIEAAETNEELDAIAKEVAALKLAKTDARRKELVSAYDNRRSALTTLAQAAN